ncbi:hypothetical protein M3J09_013624 [Ascochyta lentis]
MYLGNWGSDNIASTMFTLIDLLSTTYAPVQTMILPYLGVAEVVALTRTCKAFGQLPTVLEATAWNINHRLKRFFDDPQGFRSALGQCNGLIAGTFARRFFSRSDIKCDEIHIYLEYNPKCGKQLVSYLKDEGYRCVEEFDRTFSKTGAKGENLLVTLRSPPRAAIASIFAGAKTTADLNFISWNKAFALWPHNSFFGRESYLLVNLDATVGDHLSILDDEGINTKTVSWDQRRVPQDVFHDRYEDSDIMTRRRRIGDKSSWILNLDVEGVQSPGISDAVIETTTFHLYVPWKYTQNRQGSNYILDYDEVIGHPVLKYQYVTLAEDTLDEEGRVQLNDIQERERTSHYSRRCEELKDRLNELTLLELTKIPAAERPPLYAHLSQEGREIEDASTTRGHFKLPATWRFHDDEVIAFLNKAWEEQQAIDERDEPRRKARFFNPTGERQATRNFRI